MNSYISQYLKMSAKTSVEFELDIPISNARLIITTLHLHLYNIMHDLLEIYLDKLFEIKILYE